jgi:imidazolonepropionase-like amidohydrolase
MAQIRIQNGTIINGNGGQPISNGVLLIEDNRIKAVGRAADIPMSDQQVVIDANAGFILPGLIDTHVHLVLENLSLTNLISQPFSLRFFQAVDRMRRTLDAGITTVRDAGGADLGLKTAVETGIVPGPRMQISTAILTTTGGHVDFWQPSGLDMALLPEYPGFPSGRCDGVEAVRRKTREVLRAGADVIKVCATGGVVSPTDHPHFTQFSIDELRVIVEEGHFRQGVKVMAHAQGTQGIKNAVLAGIHSIEHGMFLDEEAIQMMLDHGTFLVPTLLAPLAVLEAGEQHRYSATVMQKARDTIEAHSDSVARAFQAGIKIAMGTDVGVMPHGTNLRELGLMCNIGMSPMESIVASTRTAADCMGWGDRLGTLETGKLADIVIAKSDPLADIVSLEKTDNIVLVMKDGQIVKDLM